MLTASAPAMFGPCGPRAGHRRTPLPIPAALAAGLLIVAAAGCGGRATRTALPFYRSAALTPEWLPQSQAGGDQLHRVADFALTGQDGRAVTARSLGGKIWVAGFFCVRCR